MLIRSGLITGVVGDDNQGVIAGLRLLGPCVEGWTGSREDRGRRLYSRCRVDGAPLRDDVGLGLTGPASVVAIIEPHVDLVLGLAALGDDRRRVYRTQ